MLTVEYIEKVKSRWLTAFYMFIGLSLMDPIEKIIKNLYNGDYSLAGLSFVMTAGFLLFTYLTYYFAYQKGGSNWLIMVIFLQLLSIASFILTAIVELIRIYLGQTTNFEAVFQPIMIFVYLPVTIYYLYNNYQLLSLNDDLRKSQSQDVSDIQPASQPVSQPVSQEVNRATDQDTSK